MGDQAERPEPESRAVISVNGSVNGVELSRWYVEPGPKATQFRVIEQSTGEILAEYDNVSYRVVSDNFDRDRWTLSLLGFQQAEWSIRWWIADLMNHGVLWYGEEAYQAVLERRDWSHKSVLNWCWIARVFKPEDRRQELSIATHGEFAPLAQRDMDACRQIMDLAIFYNWTRDKCRAEVRKLMKDEEVLAPGQIDMAALPISEPESRTRVDANGTPSSSRAREEFDERGARDIDLVLDSPEDTGRARHCRTCRCYEA